MPGVHALVFALAVSHGLVALGVAVLLRKPKGPDAAPYGEPSKGRRQRQRTRLADIADGGAEEPSARGQTTYEDAFSVAAAAMSFGTFDRQPNRGGYTTIATTSSVEMTPQTRPTYQQQQQQQQQQGRTDIRV